MAKRSWCVPRGCAVVLTQKNELWQSDPKNNMWYDWVVLTQKNELWQSVQRNTLPIVR